MKVAALPCVLALLAACTGGGATVLPSPKALPFKVVRAGPTGSCIDPPEMAIVVDEGDLIDVVDRDTQCMDAPDVTLPSVDLERSVMIVTWWRGARCAGEPLTIGSLRLIGDELEIAARSGPVGEECHATEEVLESLVQIDDGGGLGNGVRRIVGTLDGQRAVVTSVG